MKGSAVVVCTIFLLLWGIVGCGGKYDAAEKLNQAYIELLENYIADVEKVDSAKAAAKAVNRFADGMEDLLPRLKALAEKYPELKDRSNPPEQLKASQEKADALGLRMAGAMMKLMPYMEDAQVRDAHKRMGALVMK